MEEEWTGDSNAAVEEVLDRYPEAREFLGLIQATTVDEFEAVARDLAARVKKIQSTDSNTQPSSSPRNPKPKTEKVVSVKDAIDSRDWSGFLAAQWIRQNERESN